MAIIKGLTQNPTIQAAGVVQSYSSYGAPAQEVSFAVAAMRASILEDPTTPDSIQIVSAPARGEIVARPDGRLWLDLNADPDTSDIVFSYDRTKDNVTTRIDATISVAEPERGLGWGGAGYYLPETDAEDAVVVEPGPSTRLVHASTSGLSAADIAPLEGIDESNVTGDWLRKNTATGQGGLYYGETPALALNQDLAENLARRLAVDHEFTSPWLLYKRGDTFGAIISSNVYQGIQGTSALHPALMGAYGDAADTRPHFALEAQIRVSGTNLVLQDMSAAQGFDVTTASQNICLDNLKVVYEGLQYGQNSYPLVVDTGTDYSHGLTVRRYHCVDGYYKGQPSDGVTWHHQNNDRISGAFIDNCLGLLVEKIFVDHAGWGDGYRMDRDGTYPKSPEDRSHGIYLQTGQADLTIRDSLFTRNSHSAVQMRPGGIVSNVFAAGNNTGVNPGGGIRDLEGYGSLANWSMVYRYVQTVGGFKDMILPSGTGLPVIAGGLVFPSSRVSMIDSAIMNAGTFTQYTDATDIGPLTVDAAPGNSKYFAVRYDEDKHTGEPGWAARDELIVSNWNRGTVDEANVDGVDQATRDALTIGAYTDDLLSATGSDFDDLRAHLRAHDTPWDLVTDINDFFLDPFGKASPRRTVAQTVTFLPDAGAIPRACGPTLPRIGTPAICPVPWQATASTWMDTRSSGT